MNATCHRARLSRRPAARGTGFLAGALFGAVLLLPPPAQAHPALDEQIRDLTSRIDRLPGDATLHLKRGDAYREHGDLSRARDDYLRARRLDPSLAIVDLRLAAVHLEAGRPRLALDSVDLYLAERPDDQAGGRLRARTLGALGRHLEAAAALERVIASAVPGERVGPDDYLDLARAFASAGEPHIDRAIGALEQGIASLGNIVSLQIPAISFEIQAGRFASALRRIEALPPGVRSRMAGHLEAEARSALESEP